MFSGRERLRKMEGGIDLLYRMVHFDPSRRCSAKEALLSPIFRSFEKTDMYDTDAAMRPMGKTKRMMEVNFMHYYRDDSDGGSLGLAMV
jgi:hypothetical protein